MIGVFDSGYGGLTILRALVSKLPSYDYLYLGDNARAPYGDRSSEEIYEFTRQGVEYLFEQGSGLVILACNTASAVALRQLQQEWLPQHYPERRILGILVPTVEQITGVPWKTTTPTLSATAGTVTVGVLATPATVKAGAYEEEIHKRNPSIQVVQQACPGLVEAIEEEEPEAIVEELINTHLDQLLTRVETATAPLAAILLGCTHYELIVDIIRKVVPPEIRLYEQPTIVARSLTEYLRRNSALETQLAKNQQRQFITTGNAHDISRLATRYFGAPAAFAQVTLRPSDSE